MDHARPVIVLVPGAWLPPVQYSELVALLDLSGYRTIVHRLPSVNSAHPEAQSVATDAASVRETSILPVISDGHDVVLLMHSYGGIVGPAAAPGLSKKELSVQGKRGGIVGMIMLSAFVVLEGQSVIDKLINRQYSPWVLQFNDTKQLGVADPPFRFYNDMPESVAAALSKSVGLQSQRSFASPSPAPAWADNGIYLNRRVYLKTMLDHAIPPTGQAAFIASSGVSWDVHEFRASHCSFISQPKEISAAIVAATMAFQALDAVDKSIAEQ